MVSKIWVGMSFNNIDLLQFEIQSHLQKEKPGTFSAGKSELISKEKMKKGWNL